MKNTILELKNLNKQFDNKKVADNISLKIETGDICAFLGASGCGKSTLFKMISGFVEPDSGDIIYDNELLNNVSAEKRNIGMVFQSFALFPHMSVYENIEFAVKRNIKKNRDEYIKEAIKELSLEGLEKKYPNELSGGESARVAIARAIIIKPKLILLDEPFSGIDTNVKIKLQTYIYSVIKKFSLTAILITHSQQEAMSVCDKIALFKDGGLLQFDTPRNLYEKPNTKYAANFMGVANFIYKDNQEYFIRAEHSQISLLYGDIKGIISTILYLGDKIEININYDNSNIVIYERIEKLKEININDEVYVKIDWTKAIILGNNNNH